MKQQEQYHLITLFVLLFYTVLYVFSLKNNMIFGGDTMQYLNMAHKVQHVEWPLSQKWMPLYGIILGIFSWVTGSVLSAAIVVNLLLTLTTLWVVNLCLKLWFPNNLWALVLGNVLVLTNREFYYHSLSMMAEMQMLLIFLLALYVLSLTFKSNQILNPKHIISLSLLSVLGMYTKYNTIVLVLMIVGLLLAWNPQQNRIRNSVLYLAPITLAYAIWVLIKPGNEVVVTALFKPTFFKGFAANTHYYWIAFWDYFTFPLFAKWYSSLPSVISVVAWLTCLGLFLFATWQRFKNQTLHEASFLVLKFIGIYIIGFLYIATTTGGGEITIRQLNYPFFMLPFVVLFYLFDLKNKGGFYKIGLFLVLVFVLGSSVKMMGRYIAFRTTGYGELAGTMYKASEYDCLNNAFDYIEKNKLGRSDIYTNKHKVLGIHYGFEELQKLPTSPNWMGNHTFYLYGDEFRKAMLEVMASIQNKGILIYVGDDFEEKKVIFKPYIDSRITFKSFKDGFVIYKK